LWLETDGRFPRRQDSLYLSVFRTETRGVMRYLQLAEKHDLPRIVSIKIPTLPDRRNRPGEVGINEGIELLASPATAFSTLTSRRIYLNGQNRQAHAIRSSIPFYALFGTTHPGSDRQCMWAARRASRNGSAQMSLAFVRQRQPPLPAHCWETTSVEQLKIQY